MLYAKLFTSIYQGTLRGKSHGLLVFTNLLAHADQWGVVDIHPRAIAEEVGLTRDEVQAAIDELEAPDIESRSPDEGGRRIIRMDDHRAWGWQIVNYIKYRSIRNEDDRREQNRIAQATWRSKQAGKQSKPASAVVSHGKLQSAHTEAEADTEEEKYLDRVPTAPREDPGTPTIYGAISREIRDAGVQGNPSNPTFRALVDAGAMAAEFLAYVPKALAARGDRFAYLIGCVKNEREKAASLNGRLHLGALPAVETDYARSMREKYEILAPSVAARAPGSRAKPIVFDFEVQDVTSKLLG